MITKIFFDMPWLIYSVFLCSVIYSFLLYWILDDLILRYVYPFFIRKNTLNISILGVNKDTPVSTKLFLYITAIEIIIGVSVIIYGFLIDVSFPQIYMFLIWLNSFVAAFLEFKVIYRTGDVATLNKFKTVIFQNIFVANFINYGFIRDGLWHLVVTCLISLGIEYLFCRYYKKKLEN